MIDAQLQKVPAIKILDDGTATRERDGKDDVERGNAIGVIASRTG